MTVKFQQAGWGFIATAMFLLLGKLNPDKDEMMWMRTFIWVLAHKEKDAATTSWTIVPT